MIRISDDTATFLNVVLNGLTLDASAPDFEPCAMALIKARAELAVKPTADRQPAAKKTTGGKR